MFCGPNTGVPLTKVVIVLELMCYLFSMSHSRFLIHFFVLAVVALALPKSGSATTFFMVVTGQQGAQTQIDIDHSSTWSSPLFPSFSPEFDWDLGGGKFEMKDGPHTALAIALELWEGPVDSGTLIAQKLFGNDAAFCAAHPGNCQSFNGVDFLFGTPVTLQAFHTYTAILRSTAPDAQDDAYFIKGPEHLFILDATGTPLQGTLNSRLLSPERGRCWRAEEPC
jgi:hypothetical protein